MKIIYRIILCISLLCLGTFIISFIYLTGYGVVVPKQYDKYIKQDLSQLPKQDIYEKDLNFIYEELKNNYVNLNYKEKTYNFNWDDLYKKYDNEVRTINTEKDFYMICSEFVSNLRDGHVSLSFNGDTGKKVRNYSGGFQSAFDVRMIANRPIVVRSQKNLNIEGDEIVSINGVNFLTIVDKMIKYFYRGGNDVSARNGILTSNYFYNYFSYFNDTYPNKLEILLKDRNGVQKTLSFKTKESFSSTSLGKDNIINFGFYERNQLPSSKIINNVGYILIPTFNGDIKSIDDEFNKATVELKQKNVKGVVIDVRYNTGGNQSFRDILGYLTTKKIYINNYRFKKSERFNEIYFFRTFFEDIRSKSNYKNKEKEYTKWWSWEVNPNKEQYLTTIPVVVLSNEGIFSSTDTFVNTCLDYKLATVIGNMIPLSGNGLPTPIVLPSKKYILSYGFLESRDVDFNYTENVIKEPNIKVTQTLEDYYRGIDSQLNNAIEFINNK